MIRRVRDLSIQIDERVVRRRSVTRVGGGVFVQSERQVVKPSRWFRALLGGLEVIDEGRQWWHLADGTPPPARTAERAMLAELF